MTNQPYPSLAEAKLEHMKFHDSDDNEYSWNTLSVLCRKEPEWAANRIREGLRLASRRLVEVPKLTKYERDNLLRDAQLYESDYIILSDLLRAILAAAEGAAVAADTELNRGPLRGP